MIDNARRKGRAYWVVSPNVKDDNTSVPDWIRASIQGRAAFMGYGLRHRIGKRFAFEIEPGDVILIARSFRKDPQIVGVGTVDGPYEKRLAGLRAPEKFGGARRLPPFVPLSGRAPATVRSYLRGHRGALARLHPEQEEKHRLHKAVCDWLDRVLARAGGPPRILTTHRDIELTKDRIRRARPQRNPQLDYERRTKEEVSNAQRKEARLVEEYENWLAQQGRTLEVLRVGRLECDGFEETRQNLIEAKSSDRREHIRMAVGQLFDYKNEIRPRHPEVNMAILLPRKPRQARVEWLADLGIHLLWRERQVFRDNARGQFT